MLAFTEKLEAKGSVCTFKWNPKTTAFAWSYSNVFFFQSKVISQLVHQGLRFQFASQLL